MAKFNNLTAAQIFATYTADFKKLEYKVNRMIDKIKKPGYYYDMWHNYMGMEYRIVLHCRNDGSGRHCIMPVGGMNGRETYYIVDDYKYQENNRGMTHLTRHYLERYNQRCMQKNLFVEKNILMHYFEHNISSVIIWRNIEHTEYICATNTGLSFCRRDPQTNICHFCTFVSMQMLHDEQREAYDKVKEILRMDSQLFNGSMVEGSAQFTLMNSLIEYKARELNKFSQEIIQKYKDECENLQ